MYNNVYNKKSIITYKPGSDEGVPCVETANIDIKRTLILVSANFTRISFPCHAKKSAT